MIRDINIKRNWLKFKKKNPENCDKRGKMVSKLWGVQ